MATDIIAPIFAGLATLITALSAFSAQRSRQAVIEVHEMRKRFTRMKRSLNRMQNKLVAFSAYTYDLEIDVALATGIAPKRPASLVALLEEDDEEDDGDEIAKKDPKPDR